MLLTTSQPFLLLLFQWFLLQHCEGTFLQASTEIFTKKCSSSESLFLRNNLRCRAELDAMLVLVNDSFVKILGRIYNRIVDDQRIGLKSNEGVIKTN
jgi:hypothetical protein